MGEGKSVLGNRYNRFEWAGAFGDLGTLIPFVVGYITVLGIEPTGVLLTLGVFLIASGLYYKTPIPVQPMKAIGGAAIAQATLITPNMVWGAGLFTGVFWLVIALSGALKYVAKIASKPVVRGVVLGLGISFIIKGTDLMRTDLIIAFVALVLIFALLRMKRIPAMFIVLIFGVIVSMFRVEGLWQELISIRPGFDIPQFALNTLSWHEVLTGVFILAIPQIPLTLGNAVIATTTENNRQFPEHPVSEKKIAVSKGIMNIISPIFGGIPVCHGSGGMAAHIRFGARTGGSIVILGACLLLMGLFFSNSVLFLFSMIPAAVLGVMLFFAGIELAMSARDIGKDKKDFFVLLITAGFSIWNVGVGFILGLILYHLLKRKIIVDQNLE